MKNNLKSLAMVIAISVFSAATVHGGTEGSAPAQGRTWSQWAKQKAAANNYVTGSKDSRALASAKLQLGTLQMQQAKADAEVAKQQARSEQQARDLAAAAATRAEILAAEGRIKSQREAAQNARIARAKARQSTNTAIFQGTNVNGVKAAG